jgi:hypothetical protein
VKRIDKDSEDKLEAAIEPLKEDLAEVRIGIAEKDQELGDDQAYHVAVRCSRSWPGPCGATLLLRRESRPRC